MKRLLSGVLVFISMNLCAQTRPSLTVLNIDAQNIELNATQMGNLVRLELDKLDTFEVMDKYDVAYLVEKNNLKIDNCYGKICLLEIGNLIDADKMFTGSVERYSKMIVITLRLIDVKKGIIEKTQVNEFLDLQNELQRMVSITVNEMFGLQNDNAIVELLTQKEKIDNAITVPDEPRLNLSGPRMGLNILTGETADVFKLPENEGGYNANPILFQFGYQFEIQYLNEGNMQGLFEIIPLVSGLEQGLFIPSCTVLHGLRNNRNGLEFAFGPTFTSKKVGTGYFDEAGDWVLLRNGRTPIDPVTEEPIDIERVSRLDSRGDYELDTGFVLAAGMTFKSGKLNIPVNVFVVPRRGNFRYGVSFGFNARR
ncbi:MAG: hypothetical protein AAGI23_07075 [Bacteroidota bacterium]